MSKKIRVLCELENASDSINGVKFEKAEGGMLSEELTADQAAQFAGIPGYKVHGDKPEKDDAAEAAELATLVEEAKALGVDVDARWKADRLKAEIRKKQAA